jgi:hypothetical protein
MQPALILRVVKMRIMAAIVLSIAAGIPAASAQQTSWSMDHGHGVDAAAMARKAAADANAKAAAVAAGLPLKPSQSTDFKVNGSSVIRPERPRTPEEQKADAEARAAWQARCRPTVTEDRDGIRRTRYAAPDCDLSSFNTAGAR